MKLGLEVDPKRRIWSSLKELIMPRKWTKNVKKYIKLWKKSKGLRMRKSWDIEGNFLKKKDKKWKILNFHKLYKEVSNKNPRVLKSLMAQEHYSRVCFTVEREVHNNFFPQSKVWWVNRVFSTKYQAI